MVFCSRSPHQDDAPNSEHGGKAHQDKANLQAPFVSEAGAKTHQSDQAKNARQDDEGNAGDLPRHARRSCHVFGEK